MSKDLKPNFDHKVGRIILGGNWTYADFVARRFSSAMYSTAHRHEAIAIRLVRVVE